MTSWPDGPRMSCASILFWTESPCLDEVYFEALREVVHLDILECLYMGCVFRQSTRNTVDGIFLQALTPFVSLGWGVVCLVHLTIFSVQWGRRRLGSHSGRPLHILVYELWWVLHLLVSRTPFGRLWGRLGYINLYWRYLQQTTAFI